MALTNNDILKKLRVALQLRDTDIVDILKLVDFSTTTSELGAFFRNEDHPKYMELKDQILRNFLNGLVIYKRGPRTDGKAIPDELNKDSSSFVSQREHDHKLRRQGLGNQPHDRRDRVETRDQRSQKQVHREPKKDLDNRKPNRDPNSKPKSKKFSR